MQRLRSRRRGRIRRRPWGKLIPFLVLILLVIAGFLLINLWNNVFYERVTADIDLQIVNGNAKYLPWKSDEWLNAYDGQRVLQGDSIKTSERGRSVLDIYDEYNVRLSNNTEVLIEELTPKDNGYMIVLKVKNGEVWVSENEDNDDNVDIDLLVTTDNLIVNPLGTVFDVEKGSSEIVRVIEGEVSVEVLSNEGRSQRVVDQFDLGVGQQVDIGERELADFLSRLSPNVKKAIDNSWKNSDWYEFNMKADSSGSLDSNPDENDEVDTDGPRPPKVLSPEFEDRSTTDNEVTITGSYSVDETESIEIDAYVGNDSDFKELSVDSFSGGKFRVTVSISDKSMGEGNNSYEVYAVDENGNRSEPAIIDIFYGKSVDPDDLDEDDNSSSSGTLTKPTVDTFNGETETSFGSDLESITVVGGAPAAAEKIIVDDYELQKFSPGDSTWTYFIFPGTNLVEGTNTYKVEAVDSDGNKTSITFTIEWEGPGEVVDPEPEVETEPEVDTETTDTGTEVDTDVDESEGVVDDGDTIDSNVDEDTPTEDVDPTGGTVVEDVDPTGGDSSVPDGSNIDEDSVL